MAGNSLEIKANLFFLANTLTPHNQLPFSWSPCVTKRKIYL